MPRIRCYGYRRPGDPPMLGCEHQAALERHGDLDRVMAVKLRVAKTTRRFEYPHAEPLADRQFRPSHCHGGILADGEGMSAQARQQLLQHRTQATKLGAVALREVFEHGLAVFAEPQGDLALVLVAGFAPY